VTSWHVAIEWTAGQTPPYEDVGDGVLIALADYHVGAVTLPDEQLGRWGVSFSVEAPTLRQASGHALALLTAAVGNLGQRRVEIVALDVIDEAGLDERLTTPQLPELVSYAGIGRLAKVSRQRGRQIALERPGFPGPATTVDGTPAYVLAAVERALAAPARRPGRPAKTAEA
jgi:hypothetical protein